MPVRPPTFRPIGQRTKRQANAEYDAKRGSARRRGYDTRWDEAAVAFKRANPLCLGCQAIGIAEPTAVVDHVVPHKGDRNWMWDKRNWQPSCRPHHDIVKQKLEVLFAQGKIRAEELWLNSAKAVEMTKENLH